MYNRMRQTIVPIQRRFRQYGALIVALMLLAFVVWLVLGRSSLGQIMAGETFFYWGHVDVLRHAPLAILGLIAVALWGFLHRVWACLTLIRWSAILIFAFACALYTLVLPLLSLGQIAYHVESVSYEQTVYHLFYQYGGIQQASCDHVVVQCDALGLMCQHVYQLNYSALCLGERAPISFERGDTSLALLVDGERVAVLMQ